MPNSKKNRTSFKPVDGNKINNNIENLKLVTRKEHKLGYAAAYGDGFLAGLICGIRRGWRKF